MYIFYKKIDKVKWTLMSSLQFEVILRPNIEGQYLTHLIFNNVGKSSKSFFN